jgi:hypothetical protein
MFVLNPGGGSSGGGRGGEGGHPTFWFFGKLGLYFAVVRATYIIFSTRAEKSQALKA